MSASYFPLPSPNFFLRMLDVQSTPPSSPHPPPPPPPMHVNVLSVLSLSYSFLLLLSPSLSPPISLPQHGRSEFSWEGINVSVVASFLHLLLFSPYLFVAFARFDL